MAEHHPVCLTMDGYPALIRQIAELPVEEQWAQYRLLARTDLYFLLRYLLKRPDVEHRWLFSRIKMVEADPNGYLDLWSRDHYKSTIITFAKTIQDILASHGEDPLFHWKGLEPTFVIFSHTRSIAKGFLSQIKGELERNDDLKTLFPDVLYQEPQREAKTWSLDGGIVVRRRGNPKEATVEAWGLVDSQPTSKHFNVLIYDDVVVKDSVTTPEQIEKTTDAFQVSTNLGSKRTYKRGIGTRWHFADTYRHIIQNRILKPRLHPATDDGTFQGRPVYFTRERLAGWIRDQGVANAAAQLMQNPTLGTTEAFKRGDLRYYDGAPNWRRMNRYLLVDPANEKKRDSDYTAAAVLGLGADHNVYLLDAVRDRLGLRERADMVIRLHRKWERPKVGYEKYGKDADIEYIKERQKGETYHFDIVALPQPGQPNLSKPDRIRRLIPIVSENRFYLPESLWYTLYDGTQKDLVQVLIEEEMLAWPVPIHEDLLDAIARIFDMGLVWPKLEVTGPKPRDRYAESPRRGWMSA